MLKLVLSLALLCSSVYAIDLEGIRKQIRLCTKNSISETGIPKWADSEIDRLINQAQNEVCVYTFCVYKTYDFTIGTTTAFYNLPSEYFTMERVRLISGEPLEESTLASLDKNTTWQSSPSSGTPANFAVFQGTGTCQRIVFNPPAVSSMTAEIGYWGYADELTAEADVPFNGIRKAEPFQYLIVWWAASYILSCDGDVNTSKYYYSRYADMLQLMEKIYQYKPGYFPNISGDRG